MPRVGSAAAASVVVFGVSALLFDTTAFIHTGYVLALILGLVLAAAGPVARADAARHDDDGAATDDRSVAVPESPLTGGGAR